MRGEPERPAGRIERQRRRDPAGRRRRRGPPGSARSRRLRGRDGGARRRAGRGCPRRSPPFLRAASGRARSSSASSAGRRAPRRVEHERTRDGGEQRLRQIGADVLERLRALQDLRRVRERRRRGTDAAARAPPRASRRPPRRRPPRRLLPVQPLRRDVGERAGDVADARSGSRTPPSGRARSRAGARRSPRRLGEQDVRRLHVAVHDPSPVGMSQRLQQLRGHLDGAVVSDLAGVHRLPQRAAGRRTRRRCRRGRCRGRARRSAGSAGGAAPPPPSPRARRGGRLALARRPSSAPRRGRSARRARAIRAPSHRTPAAAAACTVRG